jgi:hypothetical protein
MLKIIATISTILFVLNGCTGKNLVKEQNQESAFIVLKTPTIKYAGMGFIYKSDSFVKVEVYSMGQPIMSLDINGMNVCMSTFKCMEKKDFNLKILSDNYPDTLLENIFRGKPIFNRKNLEKNSNGFIQKLTKDGKYNIDYSLKDNQTKFKDKENNILIKVKRKL